MHYLINFKKDYHHHLEFQNQFLLELMVMVKPKLLVKLKPNLDFEAMLIIKLIINYYQYFKDFNSH